MVKTRETEGLPHLLCTTARNMETAEEKLAFLGNAKLREHRRLRKFDQTRNITGLIFLRTTSTPHSDCDQGQQRLPRSQRKRRRSLNYSRLVSLRIEMIGFMTIVRTHARTKVRLLYRCVQCGRQAVGSAGSQRRLADMLDASIKWTRAMKAHLRKGDRVRVSIKQCIVSSYLSTVCETVTVL